MCARTILLISLTSASMLWPRAEALEGKSGVHSDGAVKGSVLEPRKLEARARQSTRTSGQPGRARLCLPPRGERRAAAEGHGWRRARRYDARLALACTASSVSYSIPVTRPAGPTR